VTPGFVLWYLANGDMICGCSVTNVGCKQFFSMNSPTNLSINLAVERGALHSTLCFKQS